MRRLACTAVILSSALVACPAAPPLPPPPPPTVVAPPQLPPPPETRADGHLPPLATPTRYELAFDVDPTQGEFHGTTRIAIEVPAPTSYVVLDARGLTMRQVRALSGAATINGRATGRAAAGTKGTEEELVLAFERPLPAGPATLVLAYDGAWGDDLAGLYRVKEDERWYAFTQFEAPSARRAFPCFDEPGFKTPFEVTVTTAKGNLVVANTPETARADEGAKTTFRFAASKPLPTYLVAFAVGDLDVRESTTRGDKKPAVRLVAPKGKSAQGELALEATAALVDQLAAWFGIPYPYEKLDIVAVPEFAAGAMENAGLVTFREELLLLDPSRASVRARRRQAMVIAHELAHQWFGNLVTAAWWDDLWLNEGMATWMESRIVELWQPTWGAKLDAITSGLAVMDEDALASSRAVRQPVITSAEAEEAFDGITYEKGAALLSTIERWVGEDAFKRGVRSYLEENAWKSVRADKLLGALDRATKKNVTEMASGYLDKPGVPVVSVDLKCERGGRWNVELTQEQWRPLGSKVPEDANKVWSIPVCARAAGEKKTVCADLSLGAPSLVAGRGCPAWFHPNAESTYYRFALSEQELAKLAKARRELDVAQRVTVVSNAWAGVRAGKLKPDAMLRLLPAFDDDGARQVAEEVIGVLSGMNGVLVEPDARSAFKTYVASRLAKRKKELGWTPRKGETAGGDEAIVRRAVLWAMGELAEDKATLDEAEDFAARWLADPASVDEDVAAVALGLASRRAGAARLEALRAAAKRVKTDEDRTLAIRAMYAFDDRATFEAALALSLGDEIRAHEMRIVLDAAFDRHATRPFAEQWARAHWNELRKKLPGALSHGLVRAAGVACTKAEVEERTAFYGPKLADVEGATRAFAQAMESAALCAELRTAGAAVVTRALAKK